MDTSTKAFGHTFQLIVAADNSPQSLKAMEVAVKFCLGLKQPYVIYVLHAVALNPKQTLPYIDHLEKAYNLEIMEEQEKVIKDLQQKLHKYAGKVNYKLIKVEGEGEEGPILEDFIVILLIE
jgi:nucleotide-binding universal stress UspA family protein